MTYGFEIYEDIERPSQDLIERFRSIPAPDIADGTHKKGGLDPAIKPVYRPMPRVVGPAITVSVPDLALDIVRIATDIAQPGDVIVINARGDSYHVVMGGNVCAGLRAKGIAGVVIDGACRDVSEIEELGLPMFARGVGTFTGGTSGAGEVNVPIACGGVVVNPGDIVVADEDGIAVVNPSAAVEVLETVESIQERWVELRPLIQRGEVPNIDRVRKTITAGGAKFHSGQYNG
jgi:4-hydroxy-4-methyl-2-oxoglutarate aldolase